MIKDSSIDLETISNLTSEILTNNEEFQSPMGIWKKKTLKSHRRKSWEFCSIILSFDESSMLLLKVLIIIKKIMSLVCSHILPNNKSKSHHGILEQCKIQTINAYRHETLKLHIIDRHLGGTRLKLNQIVFSFLNKSHFVWNS